MTLAHAFDLEAHRGGRALAPENTLAAFANAVEIGVTTLELDIGLTTDGVVVISHDSALNPNHTRDASGAWLTGGGPAIHSLTLAQLQRYDVGRIHPDSAYARQFARQQAHDGERIPTLAALFEQMRASRADGVRFNIETKTDPTQPGATADPETMVRALLAVIDKASMAERVTIQSFDWRTLALVGQLAPQLPRAYLTSARTLKDSRWTTGLDVADFASVPALVKAAATGVSGASGSGGADGADDRSASPTSADATSTHPVPVIWSPAFGDLTQALVEEAHVLGLQVLPWTVDRRADMERLIDWGVDGLITDDPTLLRAVLQGRGLAVPAAGRHRPP